MINFDLDNIPRIKRALTYGVFLLVMVFIFFPTFWMFSTSIKPNENAFDLPPNWIPQEATLENYQTQLEDRSGFLTYVRNGFTVAILTAVTTIIIAVPAGYALARINFPGRRALMIFILTSQMFPAVIIVIALFSLYREFSLLDTFSGLVLAFTSFSVPFSVWLLTGFCRNIPREIEEAALVDGSGRLGILVRIVLPLLSPGLIAVGLFSFLNAWNNLLFALSLTTSQDMRTIPPGFLLTYVGEFQYKWADMFAASVMVTIPTIVIFIALQRFLVEGLTAGAVKG